MARGTRVQPAQYAYSIRHDGRALAAAARDNFDLRVPGCPEWDVRALVRHTGGVHRFWGTIAEKRLDHPDKVGEISIPDDDRELLEWFEEGVEWLADMLWDPDPHAPVWTWARNKNIGFIQRRMAQETAVHRWDAQSASGLEDPIEQILAVDGVDEVLDTHVPAQEAPITGAGETVLLFESDGDMEWPLKLGREGLELSIESDGADVEARGTASDLLLMLWGRLAVDDLEVSGDKALLQRLLDGIETD